MSTQRRGGSWVDIIRVPLRVPLKGSIGIFFLGGSWVVIRGGYKPPNMAYNYSYPTYNPTYNYP